MTNDSLVLTERVFLEYKPKIYGYIINKGVPPSDRDDVFGEILLKAQQQAERYDSAKASLSTWIYIIARSVAADYFKKQRPEYPLQETLTDEFDMQVRIEIEEELGTLARQLARLPERERKIIILRFYNDMEYPEISRRLNLTEVNVRKIYSRALGKLREWMGVGS